MKIIVFSDSHGIMGTMYDVIDDKKPDFVFFLGDMHHDCELLRRMYPLLSICEVCGNNEYGFGLKYELATTLGGVRFFVTHGHKYGVKSDLSALAAAARRNNCSVALYGHTHTRSDDIESEVRCLNPGSVGYGSKYLELEVESGRLEIIEN